MNRDDLKAWFKNARYAEEAEFSGASNSKRRLSESMPAKQSGAVTPQEYVLNDIIGLVFDAGVAVGTSQPEKADQLAGLLEDTVGDMGLLIPPVGQKELELMKDLLSRIASGEMTDYDPNTTLDYGSFEAEEDALDALRNPDYQDDFEDDDTEDDYSPEYRQMISKGLRYDK